MRSVVQRVSHASVEVGGKNIAAINRGMVVLLGLYTEDNEDDMDYIIRKLLNLRIFNDSENVMNRSIKDIDGEILLVSQFTLYGDTRKGNRPSYSNAMAPDKAEVMFQTFIDKIVLEYDKVKTGIFGAMMNVSLCNDGPITILVDSSRTF